MSDNKVRGVVDLVILLDVTGSMQECIDAVKSSIATFVESLSMSDANNDIPIKDWRIKVVGYRDHQSNESTWLIDNPFVRDVSSLQSQLALPSMQASGGGDEPESLLDALFSVSQMAESGHQDEESPAAWRPRGAAARAIVFFTDASFRTSMTIPEAVGGGIGDVLTALTGSKIILCGFCPEWDGYLELATCDRAEIEFVVRVEESPALAGLGKPGDEGKAAMKAAVAALKAKSADGAAFTKVMAQLAKSLSKSVSAEALPC